MATDTWESVALPILEEVARIEGIEFGSDAATIAKSVGLPDDGVKIELNRLLNAGYLSAGEVTTGFAGGLTLTNLSLGERGARAVRAWPADDPYDAFLELVESRLADPTVDEDTKRKLRALADDTRDVGKGLAGTILTELLRKGIGIS